MALLLELDEELEDYIDLVNERWAVFEFVVETVQEVP